MTIPKAPRGTEVSAPFWQSVEGGQVKIPYCGSCSSYFFYPRSFCPHCWSGSVEWRLISGKGSVWSFTEVHFPFFRGEWKEQIPYVVALIQLEEGVRMLSNLVDCPGEDLRIGLPVELVCRELNGQVMPLFRPLMR